MSAYLSSSVASKELGKEREKEQIASSTQRIMGSEAIDMDQEARDLANEAKSLILAHTQLCTERWLQSREATGRVEVALAGVQKGLDDRISKTSATIMGLMMGVIGFLGAWAFHPH